MQVYAFRASLLTHADTCKGATWCKLRNSCRCVGSFPLRIGDELAHACIYPNVEFGGGRMTGAKMGDGANFCKYLRGLVCIPG